MRLDHAGLNVADLATASDWYCAAFGLRRELSLRVDAIELDIVMLIDDAHGHRVELLHRPGLRQEPRVANPAEAALAPGFWSSAVRNFLAPPTPRKCAI